MPNKRRAKAPIQLFALQVWHRLRHPRPGPAAGGDRPPAPPPPADADAAARLAAEMMEEEGRRRAIPGDAGAFRRALQAAAAQLARTAATEISPVCAVTGGMLAQDIIKAISGKNRPVDNWFFFDGATGVGREFRLPPAAKR